MISCSTYCSFWRTLYYLFGVLFRCSLLTSVLVSVPCVYMLIYLLIKVPELFNWIKKACSPMYRKRRRRSHVARSDRNLVTLVRNRLVTLRCIRRSFSLVVQACNSNWIHLEDQMKLACTGCRLPSGNNVMCVCVGGVVVWKSEEDFH